MAGCGDEFNPVESIGVHSDLRTVVSLCKGCKEAVVMSVADEQPRADRFNAVRDRVKEAEWWLPLSLQRPLLRLFGGRFDPYSEWNHAHRAIFIHVPRTAGTSTSRALGTSPLHFTCARYATFNRDAFDRYFKFGFVRNPWDRLLSAFSQLRASPKKTRPLESALWSRANLARYGDFEEFVLSLREPAVRERIMSHGHFRTQFAWLSLPRSNRVAMDFVGRFENVGSDFGTIANRLSLDEALPVISASSHLPYREAYTPAMRDIAADLYRADIDAFNYEF